jgi:hypothetical protein
MSESSVLDKVIAEASASTVPVSGTFFVLKDTAYAPWSSYARNIARYHKLGTGSLHVANDLETCVREVGSVDKFAYSVDVTLFNADRVLDLIPLQRSSGEVSASLLMPSGSGAGYGPTHEVADWAFQKDFQGIRYLSHHGHGGECIVFFHDKIQISEHAFTKLPDGAIPNFDQNGFPIEPTDA